MTREEAIIHIGTLRTVAKDISKYSGKAIDGAVDMAIKALEQEPKWIPVSERLPKASGKYFVTFGGTYRVGEDFYFTEEDARLDFEEYYDEYVGWRSGNVVAWMPLPEPYNAESEEEP